MVPHPRTPLGARDLRPLNGPVRVAVRADADGVPRAVQRRDWRQPRAVVAVLDTWRLDDEWWRERPIARLYRHLLLEDGLSLTLYHDLVTDAWYEQRG